MIRKRKLVAIGVVLVLGAVGSLIFALSKEGSSRPRTARLAPLIPALPTTAAPPFAHQVNAAGCQQLVNIVSKAGDGILLLNTGTFPLRLNPAGAIPQPEYAFAPKSWAHYVFRAPGTYRITGTRIGACSTYPEPHFVLTVIVS